MLTRAATGSAGRPGGHGRVGAPGYPRAPENVMARTLLWILGGILCATGVVSLLFAFSTPWGPIAVNLSQVGWDAVGDIQPTPYFNLAVIGIGLGAPILIGLNATAWKETGGY